MTAPHHKPPGPPAIRSVKQLQLARKRAAINATEDRLRLERNLSVLKEVGPRLVLREVVAPAVAVGAGVWLVAKAVGALTRSADDGDAAAPRVVERVVHVPVAESGTAATRQRLKPYYRAAPTLPRQDRPSSALQKAKGLAALIPVALKVTKMGVSYLERTGRPVPPLLHKLFAGPADGTPAAAPPANIATVAPDARPARGTTAASLATRE